MGYGGGGRGHEKTSVLYHIGKESTTLSSPLLPLSISTFLFRTMVVREPVPTHRSELVVPYSIVLLSRVGYFMFRRGCKGVLMKTGRDKRVYDKIPFPG